MGELKAIETRYKGYRFRSRLEARWAVFFDTLGVVWDYEREGFDLGEHGYYLPDFWLPRYETWWEVKPDRCGAESMAKIIALHETSVQSVIVSFGKPVDGQPFHGTRFGGYSDLWSCEVPLSAYPTLNSRLTNFLALHSGEDSQSESQWGRLLGCPTCGFEYVHFGSPEEITCDDYSAWSGRGGCVRLPMWCENEHKWVLRIGFHKGYSVLDLEGITEETDDPLMVMAGGDKHKLRAAIEAMTGARFEHGKCGEAC